MATIAVVTGNLTDTPTTKIKAALEGLGHTVTALLGSSATFLNAAGMASTYDLAVIPGSVGWGGTNEELVEHVRGLSRRGLPFIIGTQNSVLSDTAFGLMSTPTTTGSTLGPNHFAGVDAHPINSIYGSTDTFNAFSVNGNSQFWATIGHADGVQIVARLSSSPTSQLVCTAFEIGTSYANARDNTGSRFVFWGPIRLSASGTTYSADGLTFLGRILSWVLTPVSLDTQRVTQVGVEGLVNPSGVAPQRVTQVGVEVLTPFYLPHIFVTQVGVEVLVPFVAPPPDNEPPVADFDWDATDLSVEFTDLSTDVEGPIASWAWDFGDGGTSTAPNPTHVYASAGTYTVRLTVTDNDGATDWVEYEVEVFAPPPNEPPVAAWSWLSDYLTVAFTDESFDLDGSVVGWLWNFGDGETSTDQHPFHIYAEAGEYLVRLTVTDDDGATDWAELLITVVELSPLDDLANWMPLWDRDLATWSWYPGLTLGNGSVVPSGITVRGGVHDPALLAFLPLGRAKRFRASADVLLGGRGNAWWLWRYNGVRSGEGGVGIVGEGLRADTSWWGFWAGINGVGGNGVEDDPPGYLRGTGPSYLKIYALSGGLNPIYDAPSENGYAGRQVISLRLPKIWGYTEVEAGLTLPAVAGPYVYRTVAQRQVRYRVTLEVEEHPTVVGRVILRARVSTTDPVAAPFLPPLNVNGWHVETVWGASSRGVFDDFPVLLDRCAWAGYAGRQRWDVPSFQDGWLRFWNLDGTAYDAEACVELPPPVFDPPEEEEEPEEPPPDDPEPEEGVVAVLPDVCAEVVSVFWAGFAGPTVEVGRRPIEVEEWTSLGMWPVDDMPFVESTVGLSGIYVWGVRGDGDWVEAEPLIVGPATLPTPVLAVQLENGTVRLTAPLPTEEEL